MTISVSSSAFEALQAIPARYTCDGGDISPPLAWRGLPEHTRSIALIVDDPDAPAGDWVHWVCYDIPPTVAGLAENMPRADSLPVGGRQGVNDFKRKGYGGPCPPSGTHRYVFKVYALDRVLELGPGKSKKQLLSAMQGHILAQGELVGTYARSR
jgi:Raf kinase inhibitor-like YbhB/YbcL family protein